MSVLACRLASGWSLLDGSDSEEFVSAGKVCILMKIKLDLILLYI